MKAFFHLSGKTSLFFPFFKDEKENEKKLKKHSQIPQTHFSCWQEKSSKSFDFCIRHALATLRSGLVAAEGTFFFA
jgi:hypothetical protein